MIVTAIEINSYLSLQKSKADVAMLSTIISCSFSPFSLILVVVKKNQTILVRTCRFGYHTSYQL